MFSFREGRKLRHRVLKVGGLIIKYSLNDGIAAQREGSVRSLKQERRSYYNYFCLNWASTARGSPSSAGTLQKAVFQIGCHVTDGRTHLESNVVVSRTNMLLLQP